MRSHAEWQDSPDLAGQFADEFGHQPAGVWRAPGRINLIGEHTDYNDGFALPFALPRWVEVAAAARTDGRLLLRSRSADEPVQAELGSLVPGAVPGWGAYLAGVTWALALAGYEVGGAEMLVGSDLPAGSGLASSAALGSAAAVALADLFALDVSQHELARLVQRAENDFVGMPCGVMDQTAVLLSRAGHSLLLDCRDFTTTQVPLDLTAAGLALVVVDTRAPHRHMDGEYASRRQECERAAAELGVGALRELGPDDLAATTRLDGTLQRRVRHVVTENQRTLEAVDSLHAGDTGRFGRLLTASHYSLRDDYEVSCPELNTAVDAAQRAGAHGARMTGGGFGGCAIALVPGDEADEVGAAVDQAYDARGFAAPDVFTVAPCQGAHRLR